MKEIINEACRLLEENRNEWESRYKRYFEEITAAKIKNPNLKFNLPENLRRYKSISNVGEPEYDVRYAGQSIATIKFKKGDIWLQIKDMSKRFEFPVEPSMFYKWDSTEANKFRSYFKNCEKEDLASSRERYIEQLLLNDMSESKSFTYIEPVRLLDAYFQMPTPFAASKAFPQYSCEKGGGIDILARVGRGRGDRLCVIELKDENIKQEPQSHAMKQAAIYATFIAYLLRSDMGEKWWNAFGLNIDIPKSLVIPVVTLMPLPAEKPKDEIIGSFTVGGLDDVTLECHSVYFESLGGDKFSLTSDNYPYIIKKQ